MGGGRGTLHRLDDGPSAQAESERWWEWAEAHCIGWMAWSVGDRDESSASLRPGTGIAAWSESDLTESGGLLRRKLREAAARKAACHGPAPGIR